MIFNTQLSPSAECAAIHALLSLLPNPAAVFAQNSSTAQLGDLIHCNRSFQSAISDHLSDATWAGFLNFIGGQSSLSRCGGHAAAPVTAKKSPAMMDIAADRFGRLFFLSHRCIAGHNKDRMLLVMMSEIANPRQLTESSALNLKTVRECPRLTQRERQVFKGLIVGQMSKTISNELNISTKTVELHRANIMRRLGARSIADLARLAMIADLPNDDEQHTLPHCCLPPQSAANDSHFCKKAGAPSAALSIRGMFM